MSAISGAIVPVARVVHLVLTPEEVKGLMGGLLVSKDPPLGEIEFSEWLDTNAASMGTSYANEVARHFAIPSANI